VQLLGSCGPDLLLWKQLCTHSSSLNDVTNLSPPVWFDLLNLIYRCTYSYSSSPMTWLYCLSNLLESPLREKTPPFIWFGLGIALASTPSDHTEHTWFAITWETIRRHSSSPCSVPISGRVWFWQRFYNWAGRKQPWSSWC